jgi:acylglycerol lipase
VTAPVPVATPADLESTGADGLGLKGRLWAPEGTPSAIVHAVHGLKDHSGRYSELGESLTVAGVGLAAFDLRGHGRSGGDRAWVRRFPEYSADLDRELTVVQSRYPGVPVVLYGHSLGGAVAARYALDHPDRFRGLVLTAPALRPPAGTKAGTAGIVRLLSAIAPHVRVFRPDVAGFSRDRAVVDAMATDPLIDQRPIPARTASELLRSMRPILADAPRLAAPLLVLHGTADRVTDPSGSAEFVSRVASPTRQLVSVPGGYHDLLHDSAGSDLRRTIVEFVSTVARHSRAMP